MNSFWLHFWAAAAPGLTILVVTLAFSAKDIVWRIREYFRPKPTPSELQNQLSMLTKKHMATIIFKQLYGKGETK